MCRWPTTMTLSHKLSGQSAAHCSSDGLALDLANIGTAPNADVARLSEGIAPRISDKPIVFTHVCAVTHDGDGMVDGARTAAGQHASLALLPWVCVRTHCDGPMACNPSRHLVFVRGQVL